MWEHIYDEVIFIINTLYNGTTISERTGKWISDHACGSIYLIYLYHLDLCSFSSDNCSRLVNLPNLLHSSPF